MKFMADECCDARVVAGLRSDGHDVGYVLEIAPGIADEQVLELAFQQGRVLLTEDKDFGELVIRLALDAHGVVLIRMDLSSSDEKLSTLRYVVGNYEHRLLGSFVVVGREKLRIRRM